MPWQSIRVTLVPGHRVASGLNGNPRFPGGTVRMQQPHFAALGLDLAAFHPGTLNVSIAPWRYERRAPSHTFPEVKWHPVEPAETFSFIRARVVLEAGASHTGWIYLPHPETKPEHFQSPDVLELLMPWIPGLEYGASFLLEAPEEEVLFFQHA